MRSRFFLTYRFASKDDKPYSATFGQISSKSNEAFSNYVKKTSFLTLIPYNPRIKIFFKKTKTSLSSHNQVSTLRQKSKQSYEISRSLSNERTNGRTNERTNGRTNERKLNHKSQPLRGGPKNQQNSTNFLEDISCNVDLGPKRGKFEPKKAKNGRNQIFPGTFTRLFHK